MAASVSSSGRPRLLFVCHRFPYPPTKGDKIRAWHVLSHLSEHYDICLATFLDDPADRQHIAKLKTKTAALFIRRIDPRRAKVRAGLSLVRGEPLSFGYYRDPRMVAWIARQRQQAFAAEFAFSSSMAPYLRGGKAPRFIDFCDLDSAKWSAYGKSGRLPMRLLHSYEGRALAKAEAQLISMATRSYFVSPEEAALARALPGAAPERVDWFKNGIDTDYWRADAGFRRIRPGFDIVFTGMMDYQPNVDAVTTFAKTVWPRLRALHPRLTFGIVGARPTKAVLDLADLPGITVTGRVEDTRPFLAAAKVAVAPMRVARGLQNKVLEAMAMGTPVMASTAAVTGTGAMAGTHLLVADTADEMVTTLAGLLADPSTAHRLGQEATAFVRTHYQWADTLERLHAVLPQKAAIAA